MQFLHYRRSVPAPPREQHSRHNEERLTVRLPPFAGVTQPAPDQRIARPATAMFRGPLPPVRVPIAPLAILQAEGSRTSPVLTATMRLRDRVRQAMPRADGSVLPVPIRDVSRLLPDTDTFL